MQASSLKEKKRKNHRTLHLVWSLMVHIQDSAIICFLRQETLLHFISLERKTREKDTVLQSSTQTVFCVIWDAG